jgi:hypothetical protein
VCALDGLDVLLVGPEPAAITGALLGDASMGTLIRRSCLSS